MVDGEGNDTASNDVVELEAMRKDSLSWHPCQVSLCSRGLGLIVLYGHNNLEERMTDENEIFARIRVRSIPLQGDDCSSIKQGENVLVAQYSHGNGVFYDARVEKAIPVRHSKRNPCRCSFTIKWLHRVLPEEASTVPASAIMKLATTSIHLHPTISAFFSMQESPNALDAMPCSVVADGMKWEMDINVLLEQQIKEISTSTNTPMKNILKDFTSTHKVHPLGESRECEMEASLKVSLGGDIPFADGLKGSDGSENKPSVKLISETPPSIQEKLTGSRFLLSPLAARAALASLKSEFPQSPKLSARSNEKGDMPREHRTAVDCSPNADDYSLKISATLESKSPDLRSVAKKLFPMSSPPHTVGISTLSSGAQINGMEKKNNIGECNTTLSGEMRLNSQVQRDNGTHRPSQITNNNKTYMRCTDTRRVTRSRVRGVEKAEAKEYNAATKDTVASPINGQTNTRRVTRSRVKGVDKTEVNECNAALNDNVQTRSTKPGTSSQEPVAPRYCLSDDKKLVASPIVCQSLQDAKDVLGKDGMDVDIDIQNAKACSNSKRMTRSGAANEDIENNAVQGKLKLRKSNLTDSSISSERLGIQRSISSTRATKNKEQFAGEGENKEKSANGKSTPKGSESSVSTRKKSADSNKKERRFSPRLRHLPQSKT